MDGRTPSLLETELTFLEAAPTRQRFSRASGMYTTSDEEMAVFLSNGCKSTSPASITSKDSPLENQIGV
jgi:hypothetical protein